MTTKEIFKGYTAEVITDEIAEDIERHLKGFFVLLLEWGKDKEEI